MWSGFIPPLLLFIPGPLRNIWLFSKCFYKLEYKVTWRKVSEMAGRLEGVQVQIPGPLLLHFLSLFLLFLFFLSLSPLSSCQRRGWRSRLLSVSAVSYRFPLTLSNNSHPSDKDVPVSSSSGRCEDQSVSLRRPRFQTVCTAPLNSRQQPKYKKCVTFTAVRHLTTWLMTYSTGQECYCVRTGPEPQ